MPAEQQSQWSIKPEEGKKNTEAESELEIKTPDLEWKNPASASMGLVGKAPDSEPSSSKVGPKEAKPISELRQNLLEPESEPEESQATSGELMDPTRRVKDALVNAAEAAKDQFKEAIEAIGANEHSELSKLASTIEVPEDLTALKSKDLKILIKQLSRVVTFCIQERRKGEKSNLDLKLASDTIDRYGKPLTEAKKELQKRRDAYNKRIGKTTDETPSISQAERDEIEAGNGAFEQAPDIGGLRTELTTAIKAGDLNTVYAIGKRISKGWSGDVFIEDDDSQANERSANSGKTAENLSKAVPKRIQEIINGMTTRQLRNLVNLELKSVRDYIAANNKEAVEEIDINKLNNQELADLIKVRYVDKGSLKNVSDELVQRVEANQKKKSIIYWAKERLRSINSTPTELVEDYSPAENLKKMSDEDLAERVKDLNIMKQALSDNPDEFDDANERIDAIDIALEKTIAEQQHRKNPEKKSEKEPSKTNENKTPKESKSESSEDPNGDSATDKLNEAMAAKREYDGPLEVDTNIGRPYKGPTEAEVPVVDKKTQVKPEAKAEVKAEVKPEAKADVKAEVKPEAKAEVKAESAAKSSKKPTEAKEKSGKSPMLMDSVSKNRLKPLELKLVKALEKNDSNAIKKIEEQLNKWNYFEQSAAERSMGKRATVTARKQAIIGNLSMNGLNRLTQTLGKYDKLIGRSSSLYTLAEKRKKAIKTSEKVAS